ncbi:MAG: twin arginine-targeting protein translocase TatC [Elusimicrobia bacterium RIFCSPLOWO2_01_FULL_54_10]|nr:MAG: twin arginine-targeting protein translocase TatC [Elusimicrobia bacterium RIFCSPLOWO2_01_FULL_54_10]
MKTNPLITDHPRPFFEHLEELRARLIRCFVALLAGTVVAYQFLDPILAFLIRPAGRLIFISPTEAFFVRLKIAVAAGLVLAAPVLIYQAWRFVSVALTPGEKAPLLWVLPISYVLFLLGASFGVFVLLPAGIRFLLSYQTASLVPALSADAYFGFAATFALMLGAVFQMPLAAYFLGRVGVLDPVWLSGKRKVAIVAIYALCALATPGPDPVTALMLAGPTYLLFEISIFAAKKANKHAKP